MKKIIFIGYCKKNTDVYRKQIKELFDGNILVDTILIEELKYVKNLHYDLILIPSNKLIDEIKPKVSIEGNVIIYSRTLTVFGINVLKSIDCDQKTYMVDKNKYMAEKLTSTIFELGIRHLDIIPIDYTDLNKVNPNSLISYSNDLVKENCLQYDIGEVVLDVNTIIEIGMRLGLDGILRDKEIKKVYKENSTSKYGLSKLFNKLNKYESTVLILFDVIDDGYIELDLEKKLYYCNNNAIRILNVDAENYSYISIEKFFNKDIIDKVYLEKKIVKNEIITINNENIVLTIYPNINSGKFFGATAIINQFSEIEKRQDEIRNKIIRKGHRAKYHFEDIIGESKEIEVCKSMAERLATSEASIVIEGETGTGKELFAQAIHNESIRKNFQFVAVNCGALPANILESELFGYEEGAFTGARKGGKIGLFELAHRGTIFLDEIGEMPINLQMKLLRVLQEKEIMRIGSDSVKHIDIRVISATNRNLEDLVDDGNFRQDLYYRLKVLPLYIPPLRNRNIDILLLHDYYRKKLGGTYKLSDEAKKILLNHNWKGNVRELRNFVEFFVSSNKYVIEDIDIPIRSKQQNVSNNTLSTYDKFIKLCGNDIDKYIIILEMFEKSYEKKQRIGRRSLYQELSQKNIFITEQEVRRIIKELEELSLVSVGKGRKGSQITEYGKQIFHTIKTNRS